MPQILVANVIVAARLQSLDFVKNYVAKVQIFPELAKLFSNYFAEKLQSMQLFIYSNTTGRFLSSTKFKVLDCSKPVL